MDGPAKTTVTLRDGEYLVVLNGRETTVRLLPDGGVEVHGRSVEARRLGQAGDAQTLVVDGRLFQLILEGDGSSDGSFRVSVNGQGATGTVDDRRTLLRKRMKQGTESEGGAHSVKAPMPGLVLKVLVTAGQLVQKGEGLIVLEAMKMENELKAERAGRIESVAVTERTPVEKGQTLLDLIHNA